VAHGKEKPVRHDRGQETVRALRTNALAVHLPFEPRNPPLLRPKLDRLVHVQISLCPPLRVIVIAAAEFVSGSRDAPRVDAEETVVLRINTHSLEHR
jgi:hypothetical protein